MNFDWTNEAIEILKKRWAEKLSAQKIGDELGTTRNAVIGKINRLGLGRKSSGPRAKEEKPVPVEPVVEPVIDKPIEIIASAVIALMADPETLEASEAPELEETLASVATANEPRPENSKTIWELGYGDCRWNLSSGMEHPSPYYCGEPALIGKSYCLAHCRVAYVPASSAKTTKVFRNNARIGSR